MPTRQNSALMWGSFVNSRKTTPNRREGFSKSFCAGIGACTWQITPGSAKSARTTVGTTILQALVIRALLSSSGLNFAPDTLYPNSKFPPGPEALNQFQTMGRSKRRFRRCHPNFE